MISLRYTVYFWMIPLGKAGARQDTITEDSPLVTALMSAGALGTEKRKKKKWHHYYMAWGENPIKCIKALPSSAVLQ